MFLWLLFPASGNLPWQEGSMRRFQPNTDVLVFLGFLLTVMPGSGYCSILADQPFLVAQDTKQETPISPPAPVTTPGENLVPDASTEEDNSGEDVSVGEIPTVETVELTLDTAKRALDAYVIVRDKYKDAELENYESLQEFVDQNVQGKAFEADIKAAGFEKVDTWNLVVTTLSLAYGNILDNQTEDIKQQIEEVKADTEMAQDMKDRMVKSLSAMIPSANNNKVVEDLIKDQAYAEKLKSLDVESE
jgi:hypothetical protein